MISFMYDLVSFNGAPFEDYSTAKVQNPINIYKWSPPVFPTVRKEETRRSKKAIGGYQLSGSSSWQNPLGPQRLENMLRTCANHASLEMRNPEPPFATMWCRHIPGMKPCEPRVFTTKRTVTNNSRVDKSTTRCPKKGTPVAHLKQKITTVF